jgi:hypothetical protein
MPTIYTIDGNSRRGGGGKTCKRVRMGTGKRGCTIETCRGPRGRWKFQKGTMRCR